MHLFPSLLSSLHHNCSRVNSAEEKRGVAKRFVHLLLDRLKSGKRCIKETIFVCIPCNEYTLEESFFASFLTLLCVRVCPPAGKTRGLGFYIAASCFIGTNLSLVYRALIPPPLSYPINEPFNRFLSCVFSNFSSNVIFSHSEKSKKILHPYNCPCCYK